MVSNVKAESSAESPTKKNKKQKSGSQYDCEVTCLDGTSVNVSVQKSDKGEVLFNKVIEQLAIKAKEYVGLLFFNDKNVKIWLDIHKDMKHQVGDCPPNFFFRVKFYEPEPVRLKDEYMRYLLYMQLREDIREGRLICEENIYANLGSYTAQAELGDFNLSEHDHNYLEGYEFAPNQNSELLNSINELHKAHRGQTPAQAELNFLEVAKKIPRYGVDVYENVHDDDGPVEIGVAALGVNIYRNQRREYLFRWQTIADILYNRRKFTIKLKQPYTENDKKKNYVYHFFDSAKLCKQCYKSCIEYHTFFRLTRPDQPRKKTDSLRLGSSFRYSDRTLYQLRHQNNEDADEPTRFQRAPSKRMPEKKKIVEPEVPYVEPVTVLNSAPELVDEEPVQYEEVEIDEENPEDDKYDPKEWETVEKTLPDGSKKRYRRRIIVVKVVKKPKELVNEEPIEGEEVEIDEQNPDDDSYDPNEWEIVEKPQPDGTKKRYRRRIVIIQVVKKPEELVNENEVTIEEIPVDESNPDDPKYNPEEWEVVEKIEPDGSTKKYRRKVYLIRIIRKNQPEPVDEKDCKVEEVEVDENEPNLDELYDPEEWEPVERKQPDGTVKRYRRRLYIMKVVTKPAPDNEDGVKYEEEEITEDDPNDPEKYNPEEWEELAKTQPDGTVKRYRRRVVVVQIIKKPKDETPNKENEELSKKPAVVEELPIQYDEIEVDESNPEFEKLADDPSWEVVEKEKPDGTTIRVRRRRMMVQVNKQPGITIVVRPSNKQDDEPELVDEGPLSYEEIPVDESNPEDEKYDPTVWEEFEKIEPDGTKKRYRRRYTSTCKVILKKPSKSSDSDVQYEEVEIDESNPNDDVFDPEEWEVVSKELPDGTTKRYRRRVIHIRTTYTTTRYIVQTDGDEESCMELKPIQAQPIATSEQIPKEQGQEEDDDESFNVDVNMNMDDLLSEINEMSASLHDSTSSDRKPKPVIVEETATQDVAAPVESAVDFTDFPEISEEERRRREEEEEREKEGLNATIDSIFTLPDDEEVSKSPIRHHDDTFDEAAFNESLDHELAEYGVDPSLNAGAPMEFTAVNVVIGAPPPKTAPKPAPRTKESKPSSGGSSTSSVEREDEPSHDHSNEQSDYILQHDGNSEIIYTVTDVSRVEQGRGGFVQAVRAKHEHIAHEEQEANNRNSRIFDSKRDSKTFGESPPNTPKGHVPTRTVSFNENDKAVVTKTKAPPAVPAKPTVIIPDESELPKEVLFECNQSQEESHPDLELDIIEATDIPEVETEVILIREPSRDDITVAPPDSEPGVVETQRFPTTPNDTTVVRTEIIEVDMTPRQLELDDDQDIYITTEHLPTEVITKTITIEGDSTELTEEEIKQLLSQAPEELNNLENITSTEVVRTTTVQKVINGKTFTVSADADDAEMERILQQVTSGETSTTTDEDGNVIITAVRNETVEVIDGDADV